MYTKQEASALKQEFWTRLGQYLAPVPSANGEKCNWINYKTGVKAIRFRMDADHQKAFIAVEITRSGQLYESFVALREELEAGGTWNWEPANPAVPGQSRISREIHQVNVYNRSDWPELIRFFKEGITGLDRFWVENKDIFEMLG